MPNEKRPTAPPKSTPTKKASEEKFGKEVIERGFAIVPSALLHGQARLRINGQQLAILIHLIDRWWKPKDLPWPSKQTLADLMGLSAKQIQRHMKELEDLKLLKRNPRYKGKGNQTSNAYDLSGLVARLKELSVDWDEADGKATAIQAAARRPGMKRRKPTN